MLSSAAGSEISVGQHSWLRELCVVYVISKYSVILSLNLFSLGFDALSWKET